MSNSHLYPLTPFDIGSDMNYCLTSCFFDKSIGLFIAALVNQPYVVLLEYKIYKFKEVLGERCFSVHR